MNEPGGSAEHQHHRPQDQHHRHLNSNCPLCQKKFEGHLAAALKFPLQPPSTSGGWPPAAYS
uniref:DUF2946 family protein n=1 Tax=Tessaracoccus bendigoensis TaxID=72764 RepID=UPI003CCBCCEA